MRLAGRILLAAALLQARAASAVTLPASCAAPGPPTDAMVPLPQLRKRLMALEETDPTAAIRLMCDTIPRVEREQGPHSAQLAWWSASLATPLIAYMDKFQEAIPLLQFAEPILEQHLDRYAAEVADIHVAYAWIDFRQGRLADAGDAWEAARKVRERAPGEKQIELQKVLVGLAQVRLAQRDFAAAQAAIDRATAILDKNDTVSEAGAAIENVQTNIALRQEKYDSARTHGETQLRIEKQLGGGAPQLVPAYVLLGTIYARLEDFDASEAALREAIRLSESDHGPLQRHLLTALNQMATLLYERDRPREALPFAARALQVGEATLGADAPKLVGVLRTLAEVERSLGDLPQALRLYDRASRIVERNRADIERQVLVAHYRGLGNLELELGDTEAARGALQSGLDAAADADTLTVERGYVLVSLAQSLAGDDPIRRDDLQQALALFQKRLPATHPTILRVVNELCVVEIATKIPATPRCDLAAEWLDRARDVEPSLRSAVYRNESTLAGQRGNSDRAYGQALQALAAAEAVGTPQPLWRAYFTTAATLQQQHSTLLAIFFGKQAVSQIERLRGDFGANDRQMELAFLTDKSAVYRAVADWLMEVGRIDEGLDVLRLLKGQELYDFELRSSPSSAGAQVGFSEAEQRWRDSYNSLFSKPGDISAEIDRLSRLRDNARLTAAERARLEQLLSLQAAHSAAQVDRIRDFLSAGTATQVPSDTRLHDIQAAQLGHELQRFGPDTALAVYLLTPTRLRILIATRSGQIEYAVPMDSAALKRDIGHFLLALGQREDISASSRSLYDSLARPVDQAASRAHAKRLVLWLDGSLRYVPFAALSDGSHYLIERYALQAFSLADASTTHATPQTKPLRVRGLGVTQAVAGFDALPAMADELCDVVRGPISGLTHPGATCASLTEGKGALPGEGFADAAFTEQRLRTVLGDNADFSVLHIGTHFSLRPGNTMRSFLVLGDGDRLTLDSIRQLSFSGLDLVTLSACQTGLGGAIGDDGREIDGLSSIVQQNGARQVISSLWQVEDRSTANLIRVLYDSLSAKGGDGARALQQAQLNLRTTSVAGAHPYEHPFYWAGFVASAR